MQQNWGSSRGSSPFVAFVGAGASAIAPSHLSTWAGFNTVVLDAFCQRLVQFSGKSASPRGRCFSRCWRGARLAVCLGRFLTHSGRLDEAAPYLDEADAVAAQFDQPALRSVATAARGAWLSDAGRSQEALALLQPLAERQRAAHAVPLFRHADLSQPDAEPISFNDISPLRVRVLLDLNRAAMLGGDLAAMEAALDQLDVLTIDPFRGYCPAHCVAFVQCLAKHGAASSRELVDDRLSRLDVLTQEQGNPRPAQAAAFFRQQLAGADPGSG